MSSITRCLAAVSCLTLGVLSAQRAEAHPHVFAEARMEIVGDTQGKLVSVRNI